MAAAAVGGLDCREWAGERGATPAPFEPVPYVACEQRCSQASHAVAEVHGVFTAFALRFEPCAQVECCEDDIIEDPEQRLEEAEIHTTIDMETLLCAAGDSNRHFMQVSGQCIERVQAVASLGGTTFATWGLGARWPFGDIRIPYGSSCCALSNGAHARACA